MPDLSPILIKLSQKILQTLETNKLKLSKLLITSLDQVYFSESFLMSILTFSELNTEIMSYYLERLNEKIRQSFFYENQDRFISVYTLIMDLGLNSSQNNKEKFLNAILQMNEQEKNLMMEFVAQVMKRQDFIMANQSSQRQIDQNENFKSQISCQNMAIQQKFIELKQEYDELQNKFFQLSQNHSTLKKTHEKVLSQLNHLKQQKLQLLDDLSMHHNSTYSDIIQKYRKQMSEFTKQSSRLHRQLEEKTLELKSKQKELQQLILSFGSRQQNEKNIHQLKLEQVYKKQKNLSTVIQGLKQHQDEYRFEILRLKDIIVDLKKQMEEKNLRLFEQESTIDKFNKMKKLHLQFRKAMIQNYRNGMVGGMVGSGMV